MLLRKGVQDVSVGVCDHLGVHLGRLGKPVCSEPSQRRCARRSSTAPHRTAAALPRSSAAGLLHLPACLRVLVSPQPLARPGTPHDSLAISKV